MIDKIRDLCLYGTFPSSPVQHVVVNMQVGDEPGNYGKGNLGLGFLGPVADPEARKKKLSAELANGRLAMMAIIGMSLRWTLVNMCQLSLQSNQLGNDSAHESAWHWYVDMCWHDWDT